MIFSLFGRKDGRSADRRRDAEPETLPVRRAAVTGASARPVDPRELARLTAAKIDEIESQMIAAVPRVTPASAPAAPTASPVSSVHPVASASGGVVLAPPVPDPAPATDPPGVRGPSLEVVAPTLPPAFEEAAVLYSNGQSTAAATILWESARAPGAGPQVRQAWAMLFDLYQAIGRREDFDGLAIEFSARFETSPPTWDPALAPAPVAPRPAGGGPVTVVLPPVLDAQAVRQLEQVRRGAQRLRPVLLDATEVRSVDPIGADLLCRTLRTAATARHALALRGTGSLAAVVGAAIEPGRRDPSEACWLLQMELMRLLDRQQAFEDLSIDYCVTYEVSPPPWEPAPSCLRADPDASGPVLAPPSVEFGTAPDAFAIAGELTGRARDVLGAMREFAVGRAEVVLDCRRLRRLDFAAAGELLNEVVALRAGGQYLVFRDTNHVVAALLAVMGIPDLAEIRLRRH